ncbi:hypothetical protein AEGHOMDF_5808 [Methylobacterium soli]|nr:hypothetical protein AEGHOMDF_5808 [Methylobacterium soli]
MKLTEKATKALAEAWAAFKVRKPSHKPEKKS